MFIQPSEVSPSLSPLSKNEETSGTKLQGSPSRNRLNNGKTNPDAIKATKSKNAIKKSVTHLL
jgi:hypothetical protein